MNRRPKRSVRRDCNQNVLFSGSSVLGQLFLLVALFPGSSRLPWWMWLACVLFWVAPSASVAQAVPPGTVFLEAESFSDLGGWDLDQQSMDVMGSPYLLAHGLGVPVEDAKGEFEIDSAATFDIWVRTRDWVAPWKAPGAPGKFEVWIDGQALASEFGTVGAEWHWQAGGSIELDAGRHNIQLNDLTGFNGRCDAVLLVPTSARFDPPDAGERLVNFRQRALGLAATPSDAGQFDLVVCGGGLAGTAAAVSAARQGLSVALIQDRLVLGGNGSSEVRVWPEGKTNFEPFPHVGDIVRELIDTDEKKRANAGSADRYADQQRLLVVRAEPNIKLLLGHRINGVELGLDRKLMAVIAQEIRTGQRFRIAGRIFADCTGDAAVGFLAGAEYEMSNEGQMGASNLWNVLDQSNPAEVIKSECKDKDLLATSVKEGLVAAPFPRCPWAIDLSQKPFPGRKNFKGQWGGVPLANLGGWFWESGFDLDMVDDIERIRDQNLRAMFGAWDALKNVDKMYPNHRLGWAAFIAGKRESRRLLGDVLVTGSDFRSGTEFPDACFPCSWHMDVHAPDPAFSAGLKGEEFISRATEGKDFKYVSPYWVPFRALYSRNIPNLMMAGRCISVNREALGAVRVMRTTGMMGEVIGKAAAVCVQRETTPRGVYQQHLNELKDRLRQPGTFRPRQSNRD